MDKSVYQSELEKLRFTKSGKAALADAIMARQTAQKPRRHGRWMKRGRPLRWLRQCWWAPPRR